MRRLLRHGRTVAELARDYAAATPGRRAAERELERAEAYVMFIGYPRSGHSIVGALLDAHPEAVVAHELGALRYVRAGFDRGRLFHLIAENARRSAERLRVSSGYRFHVPGQWQGRWRRARIVGDKMAEGATLRLQERPGLLDRLRETVRVPVRVIHVVRNPFDNIATMALRAADGDGPDLDAAIGRYVALDHTVVGLKERLGADLREVRHEEFVRRPAVTLDSLCRWLGLEPTPEYLEACAEIVFERPHRTRLDVAWSERQRARVEERMRDVAHLAGYGFDG